MNVSVAIGSDRQASHNNAPTTHNGPTTPDNPESALLDLFEIPSNHRRPCDDCTPPKVHPTLSPLSPVVPKQGRPTERPSNPKSRVEDLSAPPTMTTTTTAMTADNEQSSSKMATSGSLGVDRAPRSTPPTRGGQTSGPLRQKNQRSFPSRVFARTFRGFRKLRRRCPVELR